MKSETIINRVSTAAIQMVYENDLNPLESNLAMDTLIFDAAAELGINDLTDAERNDIRTHIYNGVVSFVVNKAKTIEEYARFEFGWSLEEMGGVSAFLVSMKEMLENEIEQLKAGVEPIMFGYDDVSDYMKDTMACLQRLKKWVP